MSINYYAAIMVGLPRKKFDDLQEQLKEWLEEGSLYCCPPYYDGNDDEDAIVGFSVLCSGIYSPSELKWDSAKIEQLKTEFKKLTNLDAKIWLSPKGW